MEKARRLCGERAAQVALGADPAQVAQDWKKAPTLKEAMKDFIPADMKAASPLKVNAIRLLALTGARCGEILSLKWEYLDLDQGVAYLPDSKTGFKTVHLPAAAVELLAGMEEVTEWVFPGLVGHIVDVNKAWRQACEIAGIYCWRLHDLRHAFASIAVNSGHSLPQVGALLGHSQPGTTARYSHVAENRSAFALGQWVGNEYLNYDEAMTMLMEAADQNGVLRDDGEPQCRKTIDSGLRAGMDRPRHPPEPEKKPPRKKAEPKGQPRSEGDAPTPTEDAIAGEFAANFNDRLKFCEELGSGRAGCAFHEQAHAPDLEPPSPGSRTGNGSGIRCLWPSD